MRRDHFTVAVRDADTGQPMLDISYHGPSELLRQQLTDDTGDVFEPGTVDAAFRLQDSLGESGADGVFSLTHRLTGEFLLEVNMAAAEVLSLIDSVRGDSDDEEGEGSSYRIRIDPDEGDRIELEKEALFVYDADGDLLRQRSLIPSGVEL